MRTIAAAAAKRFNGRRLLGQRSPPIRLGREWKAIANAKATRVRGQATADAIDGHIGPSNIRLVAPKHQWRESCKDNTSLRAARLKVRAQHRKAIQVGFPMDLAHFLNLFLQAM